jgi:hypothetical protein
MFCFNHPYPVKFHLICNTLKYVENKRYGISKYNALYSQRSA